MLEDYHAESQTKYSRSFSRVGSALGTVGLKSNGPFCSFFFSFIITNLIWIQKLQVSKYSIQNIKSQSTFSKEFSIKCVDEKRRKKILSKTKFQKKEKVGKLEASEKLQLVLFRSYKLETLFKINKKIPLKK